MLCLCGHICFPICYPRSLVQFPQMAVLKLFLNDDRLSWFSFITRSILEPDERIWATCSLRMTIEAFVWEKYFNTFFCLKHATICKTFITNKYLHLFLLQLSQQQPEGAEIKIPGVGSTPIAVSTQLPAAVAQLTQKGAFFLPLKIYLGIFVAGRKKISELFMLWANRKKIKCICYITTSTKLKIINYHTTIPQSVPQ